VVREFSFSSVAGNEFCQTDQLLDLSRNLFSPIPFIWHLVTLEGLLGPPSKRLLINHRLSGLAPVIDVYHLSQNLYSPPDFSLLLAAFIQLRLPRREPQTVLSNSGVIMNFSNPNTSTFFDKVTPLLALFAVTASLVLGLAGCGPVSSKSNGPGLLGRGSTFAGTQNRGQIGPGFGGGFGQSVFGNQNGAGFGSSRSPNVQAPGYRSPSQVASGQAPRLQVPGFGRQPTPNNQIAVQVTGLNQRIMALDSDNQLLNTELASLKQKLQLANDYSQSLKQQLADSARQIQQFGGQSQSSVQQLAAALQRIRQLEGQVQVAAENASRNSNSDRFASAGFRGNAPAQLPSSTTLRANNSLLQKINAINIPGGQARMDGDVIRIEFPSDRMFAPGSYQIQPAQLPALQGIVGTIRQNFPKQIVGIESHWDGTPLNPATTTHHQLTATQALSVFDRLVAMGVPRAQLFTMAMGSNRPRYDKNVASSVSPNRRIELVIYPETFDGS
jgi:flagellar motor protein MotB